MSRKGKTFRSDSDKNQSKAYVSKNSFLVNKIKRVKKTLTLQPKNEQLKKDLIKLESKGCSYTRNRKSNGHVCRGCSNALGFEHNLPNDNMIKGKAQLHSYY